MTSSSRTFRDLRSLLAIAVGLLPVPLSAAPTDPVGYMIYTIPAETHRQIGVPLTRPTAFTGPANAVSAEGVHLSLPVHPNWFGGASSAMVQVREGRYPGMTFTATGSDGTLLLLQPSPLDLIQVGDTLEIIPNHSLASIFGADNSAGLMPGPSAGEADTVSLWNGATQSSRIFYFRTGEGWREAGNEAAGDQSAVGVPFPEALVLRRRAGTPLDVVISGGVPMPWEFRYLYVRPGRTLLTAPFSIAPTITSYDVINDTPFHMASGDSAAEADTIRFSHFSTPTESDVIYYRNGVGWRAVGSDADAGNTPVELGQSMDFQRRGPAGFIRFQGIIEQSAAARSTRLAAAPEPKSAEIHSLRAVPGGLRIEWLAQAGATYLIQVRLPKDSSWQDLGEPVMAAADTAVASRQTPSGGFIRIVRQ